MQPAQAYLFGVSVLLAATLVLILLVRKSLHAILVELCGAEHRATFWARLYEACLVVGVLFFSFWAPPLPHGTSDTVVFEDYFGLLRAGSFALLAGLVTLAFLMFVLVSRHDRELRRRADPPRTPAEPSL